MFEILVWNRWILVWKISRLTEVTDKFLVLIVVRTPDWILGCKSYDDHRFDTIYSDWNCGHK